MKKIFFLSMLLAASVMMNAQVAFLLLGNSIQDLPAENSTTSEDPERQAAQWFSDNYVTVGTGRFVSLSELATLSPLTTKSLWVNVDRVGLANLAAAGIDATVINHIKNYVQAGGNLLLTKQASMINFNMGRVGYAPSWGNGGYVQGNDVWTINAHLGIWPDIAQDFDRRGHAIFNGMITSTEYNAYTYMDTPHFFETMPMVGAVQRTDNNNMWIDLFRKDPSTGGQMPAGPTTHYDNGDPLRLTEFEGDWNCTVLSVWGHVTDFCGATIIEWNPQAAFIGKVLTIGAAAYQWGKSNDQIANIHQLTANCLNYLTPSTPTAVENAVVAEKPMKMIENGRVVILKNGVRYNALGAAL